MKNNKSSFLSVKKIFFTGLLLIFISNMKIYAYVNMYNSDVFSKKHMITHSSNERILQQSRQVSGKVVDQYGDSLPGVSVRIKGSSTGTATDADGNFVLG